MRRVLYIVAVLAVACRGGQAPPPPAPPDLHDAIDAAITSTDRAPPSKKRSAVEDLDSKLDAALHAYQEDPRSPARMAELAELSLTHGRLLGRIEEPKNALRLADHALQLAPDDLRVMRVAAAAHAAFNDFDRAIALLDAIENRGGGGPALDGERADLLAARGRLAPARAIRERLAKTSPSLDTIAGLARIDALAGHTADADRRFTEAARAERDPSPIALASLLFDHGRMWERSGSPERARTLYEAAIERLPELAPAVARLAALDAQAGARDRAIDRLRRLLIVADDPAYMGQLAALLRDAGDRAESDRIFAKAAEHYGYLLKEPIVGKALADQAARLHRLWGK